MAMKQEIGKNSYLLYLFLAGVFLGILFVNIKYDFWIEDNGFLNAGMLEQLAECDLNGGYLLGYILKHRLKEIILLGILALTVFGFPVMCGYICYLGLSAGCLLSVAVIRYGVRGLLFLAAGIFPQFFLLIPGYLMLLSMGMEYGRNFYYRNPEKQFLLKCAGRFLKILLLILAGCILECYVNPKILHLVLKLF